MSFQQQVSDAEQQADQAVDQANQDVEQAESTAQKAASDAEQRGRQVMTAINGSDRSTKKGSKTPDPVGALRFLVKADDCTIGRVARGHRRPAQ